MDSLVGMMSDHDDQLNTVKDRSNDRKSMSEFEFAMSATAHDSTHGVAHMLAADELFFKGKLLPLYLPDKSELQSCSCNAHNQVDQFPAGSCCLLVDKPNTPCIATSDEVNADKFNVKSIVPTISLKAPKSSIKIKCLPGLKKLVRSCCSCAASGEVDMASSSPAKSSRRIKMHKSEKSKHKSVSLLLQQNVPLSNCKARQVPCESGYVTPRNSASEPLLRCCEGGKEVIPLGYSVENPTNHNHKCHEHLPQKINASTPLDSCSNASDIACEHRCSRVRDRDEDSLPTHKIPDELMVSGSSEADARRLPSQKVSYEEIHTSRGFIEELYCRTSRRSLMHESNSGELSLERMRSANGSPKWQQASSSSGAVMNGFKSLSISRARSLERSSSYSPKSLQRKYDQLKVIRQREGWRVLERSSSYNGSMQSIRVAPVLNVPIVCMSRSKSSNNATDPGRGQNNLGISTRKNLESVMPHICSTGRPAASSKMQSRRQSPHVYV